MPEHSSIWHQDVDRLAGVVELSPTRDLTFSSSLWKASVAEWLPSSPCLQCISSINQLCAFSHLCRAQKAIAKLQCDCTACVLQTSDRVIAASKRPFSYLVTCNILHSSVGAR